MQATYIEVEAEVRYWDDATVNGTEDTDGTLIPFRNGATWAPKIRLADGLIVGWPEGTTANVHYKVCDQGLYWLLDDKFRRVAKWNGYYVPDDFLCHGDTGFGDYIIFTVGADGKIVSWKSPTIDDERWNACEAPPQKMMERIAVEKSHITEIAYDHDTKLLEVTFSGGRVYSFAPVAVEVFEAFVAAESKGTYFNTHIKGKYIAPPVPEPIEAEQ